MSTTSTPTTSRTPRTGFIVCLVIALALLVVSIIAYPHMAPELDEQTRTELNKTEDQQPFEQGSGSPAIQNSQ